MAAGHPDLLLFHDPLMKKERLTSIDEHERVGLAIITRKMRPSVLGRPIMEVLTGARLGARWRGAGVGEVGDGLSFGLDRGLQGGDGLVEGLQGRVQVRGVSHGGGA